MLRLKYISVLVKFYYFLLCMYGLYYFLFYCGLICFIKGVLYLGLFFINYFMIVVLGLFNVNNYFFFCRLFLRDLYKFIL